MDNRNENSFDFDFMTTTDSIRILKPLLPYLPKELQKNMIIFIKMKELLYVTSSFSEIEKKYTQKDLKDFDFDGFKRYCSKEQLELVNQLESMKNAYDMYLSYSSMMNQMGDSENNILNFLTDEQRAMYDMFAAAGPDS